MSSNGRPSALLTPSQRDFLRDGKDISDRGERSARSRIRKRLRDGFLDAPIIFRNLPQKDIKAALGVADDHTDGSPEIATARTNMLALIHLSGCLNDGVETGTQGLGNQLERAISMSFAEQGMNVESVSVTIDVEYSEFDEELTPGQIVKTYSLQQIRDLAAAGEIDNETYVQVLEELASMSEASDEE